MAAASVKVLLAYRRPTTNAVVAAIGANQQGRDFKRQRSSPAEEVLEMEEEELGGSSKSLEADDFELVKTLGTGMMSLSSW